MFTKVASSQSDKVSVPPDRTEYIALVIIFPFQAFFLTLILTQGNMNDRAHFRGTIVLYNYCKCNTFLNYLLKKKNEAGFKCEDSFRIWFWDVCVICKQHKLEWLGHIT